ncbi:hypothetical protein [Persephonella sp.]|nr:hypothetical protein [Aquificota bacterium]
MPLSEHTATEILKESNAYAMFIHDLHGNIEASFFDASRLGKNSSAGLGVILSIAEELVKRLDLGRHQYTVLCCSEGHLFITSIGGKLLSVFSSNSIEPERIMDRLISAVERNIQ